MTRQGGIGARGGHVRSVEEARDLQTASKPLDRWRLAMELQIHRTLLATGRFHVDDLDDLNLPPAAFEVRGTLVNSVRCSEVMESTNVYRKVSHAAANARKAPIYRITQKGRQELSRLAGTSAGLSSPQGTDGMADPPLRASTDSGESDGPIARSEAQSQKPADASGASVSPETLSLFPDPEVWAA